MTRRRKSARRLGALAAAVAGISLVAGIAVHRRHAQQAVELQHLRNDGIAAAGAGDYVLAIDRLERYLAENETDDDAVLAYATSRSKIELPGGQHLRKSIEKLDSLLARHPDSLPARHSLIELVPMSGDLERLEKLSTDTLRLSPQDAPALGARIALRMREQKFDEALECAKLYASARPDDLAARATVLHLLARLKRPAAEVRAYADAQFTATPDDPRHLLLQAVATSYAGDTANALALLRQAASRPLQDTEFVQQLAGAFDLLHRFDEGTALLATAAVKSTDAQLVRAYVVRLWQQEKFEAIATRLATFEPSDTHTDAVLLGLRAIAHYQLHQNPAADAIVAQLRLRKDRISLAWAAALAARYPAVERATINLAALNSALARDPDNAIFKTWLAAAFSEMNEPAMALRLWSGVALQMPEWSTPYLGQSQALMALGRFDDAVSAAQVAFDRRPTTATATNLAVARYRALTPPINPASASDLLTFIDRIHAAAPDATTTLPLEVDLWASLGNIEKAKSVLQSAAAKSATVDEATYLALSRVAASRGLANELNQARAASAQPQTPATALDSAMLMAQDSSAKEALAYFDRCRKTSGANQADWDLAAARLSEHVDPRNAPGRWRNIADLYPDALAVQQAILVEAQSIRGDRALVEKSINRLKAITGEQAQQWKLQRARWLIESPDVMKDCIEAVSLLSDIIRESPRQIPLRLALARALVRTGNVTGAIEHLKVAQSIDPVNIPAAMELVGIYQQQGQTDEVRQVLHRLLERAQPGVVERIALANLLLSAGDAPTAITTLQAVSESALPAAGRLTLAKAFLQSGDAARATELFDALAAAPGASNSTLAAAADFYLARQQADRAHGLIDRIRKSTDDPADIALIAARFEEKIGDSASALADYRTASEYASKNGSEDGWVALIDFQFRQQAIEQALASAERAKAVFPQSQNILDRVTEARALLLEKRDPKNLRPLIEVLSQDKSRAPEVETLRTLASAREGSMAPAELVLKLRAVADRYPCYVPLQEQLINTYLKLGNVENASAMARRLLNALPSDPAVARLATHTFRSTRQWAEMRLAADQWKNRGGGDNIDPDTAIAEALIEIGRPADAIGQLKAYRQRITDNTRSQPQAAFVLGRAMATLSQDDDAQTLLQPLLQEAAGRRMWRSIATADAKTLPAAVRWCEAVEKATPSDAWEERLSLLNTQAAIARRFDDSVALKDTTDRVEAYLKLRPRDIDAQFLGASLHQQVGETTAAETLLRSVLEALPDHAPANNDLACLLLAQNRSTDEAPRRTDEALRRATAANRIAPQSAAFADTLARAQMANGQNAEARKTFENALRLDPNLIQARVGYARLLSVLGESEQARSEMRRAQMQIDSNPRSGQAVQEEMSILRSALSRTDP